MLDQWVVRVDTYIANAWVQLSGDIEKIAAESAMPWVVVVVATTVYTYLGKKEMCSAV